MIKILWQYQTGFAQITFLAPDVANFTLLLNFKHWAVKVNKTIHVSKVSYLINKVFAWSGLIFNSLFFAFSCLQN